MSKTVHLHTPLSEEEIRSLELDDVVYLSGEAYSMLYADHYTLILDWMEQGQEIPMNLNGGVILTPVQFGAELRTADMICALWVLRPVQNSTSRRLPLSLPPAFAP